MLPWNDRDIATRAFPSLSPRQVAEAAAELQSQDQQAAKIIDLSKKLRSMTLGARRWGCLVGKSALALTLDPSPHLSPPPSALERERQRSSQLKADLAAAGGAAKDQQGVSLSGLDPDAVEDVARGIVAEAAEAADAAAR